MEVLTLATNLMNGGLQWGLLPLRLGEAPTFKIPSLPPSAELMKASQQAIERGVKDCLFIDFKRRSGHFDVTTVASIKEITEKVLCQPLAL